MRPRLRLAGVVALALVILLPACNLLTERRLQGVWESEATPKRRLELRADGTYNRRLSGKTLGFLSDVLGPESGQWRFEDGALVLFVKEGDRERSEKLPVAELTDETVRLAGERFVRIPSQTVDTPASPR